MAAALRAALDVLAEAQRPDPREALRETLEELQSALATRPRVGRAYHGTKPRIAAQRIYVGAMSLMKPVSLKATSAGHPHPSGSMHFHVAQHRTHN